MYESEQVYSFDKEDGNRSAWVISNNEGRAYITVKNSPGEKFTLFLHKANDGKGFDVTLDKQCIPQLILLLSRVNVP